MKILETIVLAGFAASLTQFAVCIMTTAVWALIYATAEKRGWYTLRNAAIGAWTTVKTMWKALIVIILADIGVLALYLIMTMISGITTYLA